MRTSRFTKQIKLALAVMTAGMSIFANQAMAAPTQGTLGATSTGVVNIQVDKAAQARISNLSDIALPSYNNGSGDQTISTPACIYSTSGSYTVTATGSGTSSAFTVDDGSSHTIPYDPQWNDTVATGGVSLVVSTASGTKANAATVSTTCSGGSTGQLNVTFLGTDLDSAPSGTFTGTITLLVAPV